MVIIVVIIVTIAIIISILLAWGIGTHKAPDFGVFEIDNRGQCVSSSNSCTDVGTRLVTMRCVPNPSSGKGCLDSNGKQIFGEITTMEVCTPTCRRSIWVDHNDGVCSVSGISPTQCVASGTIGTKLDTVECVSNDSTGTNMCTSLELRDLVGPSGDISTSHQISIATIGQKVMVERECTDYPNPICGDWLLVRPLNRDFSLPLSTDDSAIPCSFDIQLTPEEDCSTGESKPFDSLLEGFVIEPISCVVSTNGVDIATKPDNSNQPLDICSRIESPPICNNTPINSSQIKNSSLPIDFNPLICPGNLNSSNNSQCVRACRSFPTSITIGNGEFDSILGKVLMLRIPDYGYISALQTPASDGSLVKFRDNNMSPADVLDDTPLMAIPSSATRPHCTGLDPSRNVEFNTSVYLTLGTRSYSPTEIKAQISCIISGSYTGWLGTSNGMLIWKQMYNFYDGPGITSDDADMFTISNFRFSPRQPPMGYPQEYIGEAFFELSGPNGESLSVIDVDDNIVQLNGISALVMEPTVDLTSRADRSQNNCNLLHSV